MARRIINTRPALQPKGWERRQGTREHLLEAVFALVVRTLLGPLSSSWILRVLGRDLVTPTAASDAAKEKLILPRAQILKRFIADFLDLPEDHPSVARACISIMAPFCMLILSDRRRIKRALPSVGLGPDDALDMARHLAQFAIAGLEAVGRDAHKKASLRPQQNNR